MKELAKHYTQNMKKLVMIDQSGALEAQHQTPLCAQPTPAGLHRGYSALPEMNSHKLSFTADLAEARTVATAHLNRRPEHGRRRWNWEWHLKLNF